MKASRSWWGVPLIVVMACTAWAGETDAEVRAKINGTASYRERIALTPEAVFEATLEDVSRADAAAEVIARTRKTNPGQVPIAFEIEFDLDRIEPRKKYAIRAMIHEHGRLRFSSTAAYPTLNASHQGRVTVVMRAVGATDDRPTGGQDPTLGTLPATFTGLLPCADCIGIRYHINLLPGHAYMQRTTYLRDGSDHSFYELGTWSLSSDGRRTLTLDAGKTPTSWAVLSAERLRKLDQAGNPIDSDLPYELTRSASVEPIQPRVKLTGMFRYQADAARFRDCRSRLAWPVEMSGDYVALERACTARRPSPGAELMVSLRGRIEQRPRMEGSGSEPTLIVEEFEAAMPGEKCEEPSEQSGLVSNRWRPVRIGDQTVVVPEGQREPWIVLDPRAKRVTGSGGCNRISGGYQADRENLRFGQIASTMMACPVIDTEKAFLRALNDTRRYRVKGRMLELLDSGGRVLAKLEERNLK